MSVVLAAVWICLFCCVTAVVMALIEARTGSVRQRRHPADPEQVLAERFARGEIDESEYAQRLSVLRVGPPMYAYLDR